MTINSQAAICILIIRFLLTFFNSFFGRIRDDTFRACFNFFNCQCTWLRQVCGLDFTGNCGKRQIDPIGLSHRQPLVLFYTEDKLHTIYFLQRDPALPLERNAGNRKTDTFFCMIALIYKQYIKLCTADTAEKQQQCAENQKRPVAGECGNDGRGQKRQAASKSP